MTTVISTTLNTRSSIKKNKKEFMKILQENINRSNSAKNVRERLNSLMDIYTYIHVNCENIPKYSGLFCLAVLAKSKKTLLELEECEKKMELYTPEERGIMKPLIDLVKQVITTLLVYCSELEQTIYMM